MGTSLTFLGISILKIKKIKKNMKNNKNNKDFTFEGNYNIVPLGGWIIYEY